MNNMEKLVASQLLVKSAEDDGPGGLEFLRRLFMAQELLNTKKAPYNALVSGTAGGVLGSVGGGLAALATKGRRGASWARKGGLAGALLGGGTPYAAKATSQFMDEAGDALDVGLAMRAQKAPLKAFERFSLQDFSDLATADTKKELLMPYLRANKMPLAVGGGALALLAAHGIRNGIKDNKKEKDDQMNQREKLAASQLLVEMEKQALAQSAKALGGRALKAMGRGEAWKRFGTGVINAPANMFNAMTGQALRPTAPGLAGQIGDVTGFATLLGGAGLSGAGFNTLRNKAKPMRDAQYNWLEKLIQRSAD